MPGQLRASYEPSVTALWLVCVSCGTQYPTASRASLTKCNVCDDPRHYAPPTGQSFTTMFAIRAAGHRNVFYPYEPFSPFSVPLSPPDSSPMSSRFSISSTRTKASMTGTGNKQASSSRDERKTFERDLPPGPMISIVTEPKFAMGQRAILIRTSAGNILWDCLTLLDEDTIHQIEVLGGLAAIVISHPHFYTTHAEWASAFGCPVYVAFEDRKWLTLEIPLHEFLGRGDTVKNSLKAHEITIDGKNSGFTAIRLGGHFPGSMVGLFDGRLLLSDTIHLTPGGLGGWEANAAGQPRARPKGMNSFAFMWSVPNCIPLSPEEINAIWTVLKQYEFRSAHGAMLGQDVEDATRIKKRMAESMQTQLAHMGLANIQKSLWLMR